MKKTLIILALLLSASCTTLQFVAAMAMRSVLLPNSKGIDELDEKYKDKDAGTMKVTYLIIAPWFVLFLGWIVKIVLF